MYRYISVIILIAIVCSSCRQIYDPKIDDVQSFLVVEGLITDQPQPYAVKLTMASLYESADNNNFVEAAKVSILDDQGKTFKLSEAGYGTYVSDPTKFIGQHGRSYTLHIETKEGNIYESSPQVLLANDTNVIAHAEFTTKDVLVEDAYGDVTKLTKNGVDLLFDIQNNSDTLPRFRFIPTVTTEYTFTIVINPFLSYVYFGWSSTIPIDIANITDEPYQTSSNNIQNHTVCFIPTENYYPATYRDSVSGKDSIVYAPIINRVITVKQYRLNSNAYQFYKNVNTLLSASGKLFDPIAFQLKGNITCKNNPEKVALGFFETSSLRTSYYYIRTGQKKVYRLQSFNPSPPSGFIGTVSGEGPIPPSGPPAFWVY